MVSLEVVQLLNKVVPKWLTWSFQGSESPFNLTVPNSVLSFHPTDIHIVFDLAGSGSVLNIRSLCVACVAQMLTMFCRPWMERLRRMTSSAKASPPNQCPEILQPEQLDLSWSRSGSRYVAKPPFGLNTPPCLVPFVTPNEYDLVCCHLM